MASTTLTARSEAGPSGDGDPGGWLPSVTATLLTPLFVALLIGLRSAEHRAPCALSLGLAAVPILLRRHCPNVTRPGPRFALEIVAYLTVGAWLALALWSVLDHHR